MLKKTLENIFQNFDSRERDIVLRRFGLNGEKETLEAIGYDYGLTRERIRQIQLRTLNKIKALIEKDLNLNNFLIETKNFLEPIGVKSEKSFFKIISETFSFNDEELNIFKFFSLISNHFVFHPSDAVFNNFYAKDEYFYKLFKKLLKKIYLYFLKKFEPIHEEEVVEILWKELKKHLNFRPDHEELINILTIFKNLDKNPFKLWGLSNHHFINPRCLRHKIYLILKFANKPLHFREIYEKLNEIKSKKDQDFNQFWFKNYNINSLKNELIKHSDFVMVDRGVYGLREWGLIQATAKEILLKILAERKKITVEELWQIISSQKQIKKSSFKVYLKELKDKNNCIKEVGQYLIYDG